MTLSVCIEKPPQIPVVEPKPVLTDSAAPWAVVLLVVLLAAARLLSLIPVPLTFCTFKMLTGCPCAFCGSTRAFIALSRFEFATALSLNPLATVVALGVALQFVAWAGDHWLGVGWLRWVRSRRLPISWFWPAALALIANWIYVIAAGR